MSTINAALVTSAAEGFVTTGKIPYPTIEDNEVLIKAVAYAANPTDWKHVAYGLAQRNDISGSDVSGVVVKVGANATGFKEGDVVSTFLRGGISQVTGAFAEYVRAPAVSTIKYDVPFASEALTPGQHYPAGPINTFEGAASVTLGLVTVTLAFAHSLKIKAGSDKAILIWSGSTATGILAIQLAKILYGLKVITTASPKHHEFLKSLGADAVFDYKDPDVTTKIKDYAKGSIVYGFDTVANKTSFQAVYDASEGADEVYLDTLLGLSGLDITEKPGRKVHYGETLAYLVFGKDVNFGHVFKYSDELLADYNSLWPKVVAAVPKLKHNKLRVLEPGLATASEALTLLQQDKVSGEKLVWRAA